LIYLLGWLTWLFGEFYFIISQLILLACSYLQLHSKKPPPRTPAFEVYFISAQGRAKPQPSAATSFNTSKHQLHPIHSSAVFLVPAHPFSAN
jgi:hypothetical protein